jgi:alpha-glucosidase
MRELFDQYDDRVLIGEIYLPVEKLGSYYGADLRGAHLPFNFQLISAKWDARHLQRLIEEYEDALPPGGWPNWVLGNHDQHRIATRVGRAQARVAAMMLLTLRGTPTLYYGDEIGMVDVPIPPEMVQDPFEKNVPGKGLGRDPERTPMQWDAGQAAGFTTGKPWLPIARDHGAVNVDSLRGMSQSILTLYQRLLALRRAHSALATGRFTAIASDGDVLAYLRRDEATGEAFLVALNLGHQPQVLICPPGPFRGHVALSTHLDRDAEHTEGTLELRADEGLVIAIQGRNVLTS